MPLCPMCATGAVRGAQAGICRRGGLQYRCVRCKKPSKEYVRVTNGAQPMFLQRISGTVEEDSAEHVEDYDEPLTGPTTIVPLTVSRLTAKKPVPDRPRWKRPRDPMSAGPTFTPFESRSGEAAGRPDVPECSEGCLAVCLTSGVCRAGRLKRVCIIE